MSKKITITFQQFKNHGSDYLGDYKVVRGDGSYWEVKYFSPYQEDLGKRAPKHKGYGNTRYKRGLHRCFKCKGTSRTRYTIPFDLREAPGWYCLTCRKKYDILDINIAKKHRKIT